MKRGALLLIAIIFANSIFCTNNVFAETSNYPNLGSEAAVLMDAQTGQVLFEKNMNLKEYPASITKIMTAMLALEKGNLNDMLTMSNEAVFSVERDSSHIALDVGEQLSLEQALYAISIDSANDAANGVAEYISGNLDSFATLMTKRAVELGALNTNFSNSNGLSNPNHYTTAYDMALIMRQAIKTPNFIQIFSEVRYDMLPTNIQEETRYFNSRNPLINGEYQYEGIIASKTGWTPDSKHTLATAAKRGNRELIVVILNSQASETKYNDTMTLLDYGFNNFNEIVFDEATLMKALPGISENGVARQIVSRSSPTLKRLIYMDLAKEDVSLNYELIEKDTAGKSGVKIEFNLQSPSELMYPVMGEAVITQPIEQNFNESTTGFLSGLVNFAVMGFKLILAILLVIAVTIAFLAIKENIRYRKRKARRSLKNQTRK